MDLKKYRHIYPKLRLSWSLYQKFARKDIIGIFDYLTDKKRETNEACSEGTRIHTKIELEGIKNIRGIEKLIDISQDYFLESKVILERKDYLIVCKPDLYNDEVVIDWKTGGTNGYEQQLQLYMWAIDCKIGYLVPIGEREGLYVKRGVKEYRRSRYAGDWEYKFEDMANDIQTWIKNGQLDRYLKNY